MATETPEPIDRVPMPSFAGVRVEHTFTAPHFFQLWDTLTDVILRNAKNMNTVCAQDIARGLMAENIVELGELNRVLLATDPDHIDERDLCTNTSCDGPKQGHKHGTMCGPLCSCGEGE